MLTRGWVPSTLPHPFVSTGEITPFRLFSQHLTLKYQFFSCINGELRLIQEITSVISVTIAILLSLYIVRQTKRTTASIPSLSDFIKKGEDGEIIMREDLAMVIDAFGQRMAKGIKMSFLQGLGAQAKIEKGLKGAMAQDIIEEKMPLLNLAGDILGFNTKQYIAKHPDALGQLIQLAGPLLQGGNLGNIMGQGQSQPQNDGVGGYG